MTSCVLSLFLLVCLSSSITADDPTGLKVRITNRAENILKDVGLEYLNKLVNKPSPDFQFHWTVVNVNIKGLTLTHLTVNPDQVVLSFQQNSGLQLEIQDLDFTGRFEQDISLIGLNIGSGETAFGGEGVSATIRLKLNRNQQGRLNVEMLKCEFRANNIVMQSSSKLGRILDFAVGVFQTYFTNKICPAIERHVVPKVNSMLENLTMVMTLNETLGMNVDYSLSRDVTVTSNSVDVPFKGLVFRQGQPVNTGSIKHVDPVFRESDLMVYVGVSEFFFNSAVVSLYSTGIMAKTEKVTDRQVKNALRALQVFRQPLQLRDKLYSKLEITKAPSISISQRDGVIITGRARGRVFAVRDEGEGKQLLSVSATCTVKMKIDIKGNKLTLPSDKVDCKIITKNKIRDFMVKPLNVFLTNRITDYLRGVFADEVPIPLPEGVGFTQGKIDYHDGFVVVGGSLNLSPAVRQKLVKDFGR